MKTCSKCQRTLPETSFVIDRRRADGLVCICKKCRQIIRFQRLYPSGGWETVLAEKHKAAELRASGLRICSACAVTKPNSEFYAGKATCKECRLDQQRRRSAMPEAKQRAKERNKRYWQEKKDVLRAKNREWRRQHKDELRVKNRENVKRWRSRPEVKIRLSAKNRSPEARAYRREYMKAYRENERGKEYDRRSKQRPEYKAKQAAYQCRPDRKAKARAYYRSEKGQIARKSYWAKPEVKGAYNRKQQERRKTDPHFRLRGNLTRRINMGLRGLRKSAGTMRLIGCTIHELWRHLETHFLPGMTRDNYGEAGWQVDHWIPLRHWDLTAPDGQQVACNWKNLYPAWARENAAKADRLPHDLATTKNPHKQDIAKIFPIFKREVVRGGR